MYDSVTIYSNMCESLTKEAEKLLGKSKEVMKLFDDKTKGVTKVKNAENISSCFGRNKTEIFEMLIKFYNQTSASSKIIEKLNATLLKSMEKNENLINEREDMAHKYKKFKEYGDILDKVDNHLDNWKTELIKGVTDSITTEITQVINDSIPDIAKKVMPNPDQLTGSEFDQKMPAIIENTLQKSEKKWSDLFNKNKEELKKSYSDAVQKNASEPSVTISKIKNVVKNAVQNATNKHDRNKNLVLFGLTETDDEDLIVKVEDLLLEIGDQPKLKAVYRFGKVSINHPRPVRISFDTSAEVHEILKCKKWLKRSLKFRRVFITIDRTPEQQKEHKKLVAELRDKLKDTCGKKFYIMAGKVRCDGEVKTNDENNITMEVEPVRELILTESMLLPVISG